MLDAWGLRRTRAQVDERSSVCLPSSVVASRPVRYWLLRAAVVTLLAAPTGCATTHLLQPVGKNNLRVNASLGGPILRRPVPIPAPIVAVDVAYGIEDDIDLHASVQPLAMAFSGGGGSTAILSLAGGAVWHPIPNVRHALSIGGSLQGMGNRRDAVVFADAWIGGAGRPTRWLLLGGGVHNMLRIGSSDRELDARPFWTPTLFGLAQFSPTSRFSIDLEMRWYAFSQNAGLVTVDWLTPGGIGVIGAMLGFNVNFGPGVR